MIRARLLPSALFYLSAFFLFAGIPSGCCSSPSRWITLEEGRDGGFVYFESRDELVHLFEAATGLDMNPRNAPWSRDIDHLRSPTGDKFFLIGHEREGRQYRLLGAIRFENGSLDGLRLSEPGSGMLLNGLSSRALRLAMQEAGLWSETGSTTPTMHALARGRSVPGGNYGFLETAGGQVTVWSLESDQPVLVFDTDELKFPKDIENIERLDVFETSDRLVFVFYCAGSSTPLFLLLETPKASPTLPLLWRAVDAPSASKGKQRVVGQYSVLDMDPSGQYAAVVHYQDLPLTSSTYLVDIENQEWKRIGGPGWCVIFQLKPLPSLADVRVRKSEK